MFETLWLLSGLAGSLLIWRLFKRIERNNLDFTWCPSPLGIFFMLAFSIFGPVILGAAVVVTCVIALDEIDFKENWLTRPICRKQQ